MGKSIKRVLFIALGSLCAALGIVGMFVPVLPTTPLLLLAGFLFARSSQKLDVRLKSCRAYQAYVVPFLENRSIPRSTKARMLVVSGVVMSISAFAVSGIEGVNYIVWAILAAVMLFLLYLMVIRIPTTERIELSKSAQVQEKASRTAKEVSLAVED